MTLDELGQHISDFKSNLTSRGIDLPVSTGDLGDDWTQGLASTSDIIMANIHLFFAGVQPDEGAGWSHNFFEVNNIPLTTADHPGDWPQHIVSEIGWPSQGGNNCGTGAACPDGEGAIAGIDELNTFMEAWVCPSLSNGTTFFWFSCFDVSAPCIDDLPPVIDY